jgi:hypothetical protein
VIYEGFILYCGVDNGLSFDIERKVNLVRFILRMMESFLIVIYGCFFLGVLGDEKIEKCKKT